MDVRLEQAIMNRQNIPSLRLSVRRILSCNGMSLYENPCFNRLIDRLQNDDSLMVDYMDDMDILLDDIAFSICSDIIAGYVGQKLASTYEEYIKSKNDEVRAMNMQARLLREAPDDDLKKICKNPDIYCGSDPNYSQTLYELCKTELQARSVFNLVRNAIKRVIERTFTNICSIPFRVRIKRLKRQIELEI